MDTRREAVLRTVCALPAFWLLVGGAVAAQLTESKWLGSLAIPDGRQFRIGIEVFQKADGSTGAAMCSPDQGSFGIPIDRVVVAGDSVTFTVAAIRGSVAGRFGPEGNSIQATWHQPKVALPIALDRVEALPQPEARPQEPVRPYPYRTEEVVFPGGGDGVWLAGTLSIPKGTGPFPAAVLIHGSGPHDRDEELAGHRIFVVLADHLTRRGIEVLRYDKRGIMRSTGDFSTATTQDFAADAAAAMAFLCQRKEVASGRIGLIGHSEGGNIAPIVAAGNPAVAYTVLLAGTGIRGYEVIVQQDLASSRAKGATEEELALIRPIVEAYYRVATEEPDVAVARQKLQALYGGLTEQQQQAYRHLARGWSNQIDNVLNPWSRAWLAFDPAPVLQKVRCPVLAICGDRDVQVLAEENLAAIRAALEAGGNPDHTVRTLPGLNHLFQHADTGAIGEYSRIDETISPGVLTLVSGWVTERAGNDR